MKDQSLYGLTSCHQKQPADGPSSSLCSDLCREDLCAINIRRNINAESIECDKEEHEEHCASLAGFVVGSDILSIQSGENNQSHDASTLRVCQSWLSTENRRRGLTNAMVRVLIRPILSRINAFTKFKHAA